MKVTKELVDAVIKEQEKREETKKYNEQKDYIQRSIKAIEENKSITETEKRMHLAKLKFNETQLEVSSKGKEAIDEMNKVISENAVEINRLNLSSADGKGVIEMLIPKDDFEKFDKMMEASAKYWESRTELIKEIAK